MLLRCMEHARVLQLSKRMRHQIFRNQIEEEIRDEQTIRIAD